MKTIALETSIVNLFQQGLSWDIFVQGFIFLFAISFSTLFFLYLTRKSGDESFLEFVIDMYKSLFLNFFSNTTVIRDSNEIQNENQGGRNDANSKTENKQSEYKNIPNSYILQSFRLVSLTTTLIVISYIMGAMVINLSDKFMDRSNRYHLGLKKLWVNPEYYQKQVLYDESRQNTSRCTTIKQYRNEIEATDKQIKLKVFDNILGKYLISEIQEVEDKVFVKDSLACPHPSHCTSHKSSCHYLKKTLSTIEPREKIKIYFFSKNATLSNPKWASYLSYSQILVNINQTLCFSFWLMLIASLMGFFTTIIITTKEIRLYHKDKNNERNKIIYLIVLSYCIIFLFLVNFILDTSYPYNNDYTLVIMMGIIFITTFLIQLGNIKSKKRLKTSLIITIFSTVMYLFSANAWQELERESCDKTYGLFEYHALEKGDKKVGDYIIRILNDDCSELHLNDVEKKLNNN